MASTSSAPHACATLGEPGQLSAVTPGLLVIRAGGPCACQLAAPPASHSWVAAKLAGRERSVNADVLVVERSDGLVLLVGLPGVVILSGDQHWSSAVQLAPYALWKLNAMPLAQTVRAQARTDDPRLALTYDESTAFGIVDVDTRGRAPHLTFSVIDGAGRVRGSHVIDAGSPAPDSTSGAGRPPGSLP
jgi:hypothetical protein